MTKISQLSAIGAGLARNDQLFVRDVSDASTPVKSVTPADILAAQIQASSIAVNTSSTLTPETMKNGIVTSTAVSPVVMTLPLGSAMEASYTSPYANISFDWHVINQSTSNSVTVSGSTGHITVGSAVITSLSSGHFRTRRSGASNYITYRLS